MKRQPRLGGSTVKLNNNSLNTKRSNNNKKIAEQHVPTDMAMGAKFLRTQAEDGAKRKRGTNVTISSGRSELKMAKKLRTEDKEKCKWARKESKELFDGGQGKRCMNVWRCDDNEDMANDEIGGQGWSDDASGDSCHEREVDGGVRKDDYSGQSKQLPVDAGVRKDDYSGQSKQLTVDAGYSGQSKQLPVDVGVRKDDYSGQSKQLPVDAGVRKDDYSGQSKQLTVDAGYSGQPKQLPVDAGVRKDDYSGQSKQLPVVAGVRKDDYSGQSKQLTVDAGVRKDDYSGQSEQLPVDAGVRKDDYSGQSEQLTVDASGKAHANVANMDGLRPPQLYDGTRVTGSNKKRLRIENKQERRKRQAQQQRDIDYWSHQNDNVGGTESWRQVKYSVPTPKQPRLASYRGGMCPSGDALRHPAASLLNQYAKHGCPVETGKNWTLAQMEAAIQRGPHVSALEPEAMEQLEREVKNKVEMKQAKVILWDDIKDAPPEELKISPIAMIPHKSRMYRAILDLSFAIKLEAGGTIPAVNDTSSKTAPAGAIDQIGHVLDRLICAFAQADLNAKIFMAKWDIKDGFWRLDCQEGQEWNFAYVLPQPEGKPVKLVVPTSLQMGWIESPPYFCAASETARDVAQQNVHAQIGTLAPNKFLHYTKVGADYADLAERSRDDFPFVVEVYVDDFISLAIPTSREQLDHVASAVMNGVHDVFPKDEEDGNDPISEKKLKKQDGAWMLNKDILGFDFDGHPGAHTMILEQPKRQAIQQTLHTWLRQAAKGAQGIPFHEFHSTIQKLRHAFKAIPQGVGLLSPCNQIVRLQPRFVFLTKNLALREAITDCQHILTAATTHPTPCKELVTGHPDYVGVKDASGHGVGGVIFGENKSCPPTVFRFEWPEDIKRDLVSFDNPNGSITNSDLECAGLLMLWIVMEDVCNISSGDRVAVFSDNNPTVSWATRLASKSSRVAAQLIRGLALRMKVMGAAPLTALHIKGKENAMTDIPSRSFGSEKKWHCKTNTDLQSLFTKTFPLPQTSWTVYQLDSEISTRILSVLRMKGMKMDEWLRLPKRGRHIGKIGAPMSNLWGWSLTYRRSSTDAATDSPLGLRRQSELGSTEEGNRWQLEQSLRHSLPLERRFPWSSK